MKEIRFGIIGMGVQGSYYADILAGRQRGGVVIPQPEGCVLGAICSRSDKSREAARLGEHLIATGLDGLRQVELANAIQLSGWVGEMIPVPCDSERYDRELKKRMDQE